MKIKRLNYYGFDHEAVNKKFKGGLTYLADVCLRGGYAPWAMYRCANPDRAIGHKDFVFLKVDELGAVVTGLNEDELGDVRYHKGLWCLKCDEVVYSCMRHDYHHCSCERVSVDGGYDYFRFGFSEGAKFKKVKIDFVRKVVVPLKDRRKK